MLIGGGGERKTLQLVAQYADACNLIAGDSVEEVAHKLEVLDRHCADVGRDPAEIERTIDRGGDPLNDPDGFLAAMERYARLGVTRVGFGPTGPDPAGEVARVCETVFPRLKEI